MADAAELRRCEDCGFASPEATGFQRRGGGLRRTRALCGACAARADDRAGRRAFLQLTLLWPMAGTLCLLAHRLVAAPASESLASRLGWAFLNLSLFLAGLVLVIPAHEAGHALVGRLVGWRVVGVTLGHGPLLFERVLAGIRLRVHSWPWGGFTLSAPRAGSRPRFLRLRWLAILSAHQRCSLAATGAVHTGLDAARCILAGAHVVQVVSMLLQHGPEHLRVLREELSQWMERRGFESLERFRASLNLHGCPSPEAYERANYMLVLQGWSRG